MGGPHAAARSSLVRRFRRDRRRQGPPRCRRPLRPGSASPRGLRLVGRQRRGRHRPARRPAATARPDPGRAGSHRGARTPGRRRAGRGRRPRRHRQSPSGQGLCQGGRSARQDRCAGCCLAGPLRRDHSAAGPAPARCRGAGTERGAGPATAGSGHAHRRGQPARLGPTGGPAPAGAAHRLSRRGAGRGGAGAGPADPGQSGLARAGRAAAQRARGRRGAGDDAAGRAAGAGTAESQGDRGAGRGGAARPRQWPAAGSAHHLGRPESIARRAVHGCPGGGPVQPGDPGVRRAVAGGGQAHQGGADRVHAQAADDPQCHAAPWGAMGSRGGRRRWGDGIGTRHGSPWPPSACAAVLGA